ncbi:hypothetical protein [Enterovibrio norvegicus]|uniref:hypothetical protein n=1 Tax=Enterovibrio norvegicus TaxID=188144 RepID=UPI0035524BB5
MLQREMQSGERTQFRLVGEFIYIDQAPAMLRVTTSRGSYELEKGAQIIDAKANGGDVHVELTGGEAGFVRIISGFGQYVPPADGQKVNVSHMPAIAFDGEQPVALQSLPPVAFDGAQPVSLQSMPRVAFDGRQPVELAALPAVAFDGAQPVAVQDMPRIKLETGQTMRVYTGSSALWVYQRANGAFKQHTVTLGASVFEVTEDNTRTSIELDAASTNGAPITIYPSADDAANDTSGLVLNVGASRVLDVYGALFLKGTEGDAVSITEFLR